MSVKKCLQLVQSILTNKSGHYKDTLELLNNNVGKTQHSCIKLQPLGKDKVYVQATHRSLQKVYSITGNSFQHASTIEPNIHRLRLCMLRSPFSFLTTLSNTTTSLIMVHKKLSLSVWLQCL